ncbi:MAG: FtsQ-type POTRA domain-containing protein [Acidimicrobiia bacterium]
MTVSTAARRRRRVLFAVIALAAVGTAAWIVTRSPFLDVDHLQVVGNTRETSEEVAAAAGLATGDPMMWIDPHEAAKRVEALPWVATATVSRVWPDTVKITVSERTPVAWVQAGEPNTETSRALVIDAAGRVLSLEVMAPDGLPQLLNVPSSVPVGATVDAVTAARVAGVMATFDPRLAASIEVKGDQVLLRTPSGTEIRLGRAVEVADKIRAAIAVLGTGHVDGAAYLDVSAPSNPVAG